MWANLAREKDSALKPLFKSGYGSVWVVVKIMAPFWIPIIIRHQYLGCPERDHNFDNHPYWGFEG